METAVIPAVTCAHCRVEFGRDEHGILTHGQPECDASLLARALRG